MKRIVYDYTFMRSSAVGRNGFKDSEIEELYPKLESIKKQLLQKKQSCQLEFACLPFAVSNIEVIKDKARDLAEQYDTMVVVGIGGSDLGTRSVYNAVSRNGKLKFLGNTTDPSNIDSVLSKIDLSKACFNFISRSGETIEVLSVFHFLKEKLKKEQIVVTAFENGHLYKIAKNEGYFLFEETKNTPDRFGVLSVVGLFPLSFAGVDIDKLLSGASDLSNLLDETSVRDDPMLIFSAITYLAYIKRKQDISVFMPYLAKKLSSVSKWYQQLIAESLGKKGIGITPVNLNGPTDQHSFLQLLIAGPKNKVVNFVKVEKFEKDYEVPEFKGIKGKTFGEILNAEQLATSIMLSKAKVPNATFIIPEINAFYLGQLLYFFEIAVSYLGELFEINAFDQPAVESNKVLIEEILKEKEFPKIKRYTI